MQVDVRSLARAEARQEAGGAIGVNALEILANIDAMQLAIEEATAIDELGVDQILAVHHVLLQSTQMRSAGAFREGQNWIGGNDYNPCDADFVPPPPEFLGDLMADLLLFCNDDSLPPLVQAAIAHAQFETIHPFEDGNGRTGRALTQIVLRKRGLAPAYVPPISVVLASQRDRYIKGLGQFRAGHDTEWIEIFAVAAAQGADLADRYLKKVIEFQEEWRERLRAAVNPRSDAAAWPLIDALPGHPIITTPVAVASIKRSRPATNQAIQQLAESGILRPLSQSQRNRAWEVSELLDLLSEIEGS